MDPRILLPEFMFGCFIKSTDVAWKLQTSNQPLDLLFVVEFTLKWSSQYLDFSHAMQVAFHIQFLNLRFIHDP
jgi:hypothetical protein